MVAITATSAGADQAADMANAVARALTRHANDTADSAPACGCSVLPGAHRPPGPRLALDARSPVRSARARAGCSAACSLLRPARPDARGPPRRRPPPASVPGPAAGAADGHAATADTRSGDTGTGAGGPTPAVHRDCGARSAETADVRRAGRRSGTGCTGGAARRPRSRATPGCTPGGCRTAAPAGCGSSWSATGGELVAAAPLMLRPPAAARRWCRSAAPSPTSATCCSTTSAPPRRPPRSREASPTAARSAVIDLREVRPGGAAERVYDALARAAAAAAPTRCAWSCPACPMDDLVDAAAPAARAQRVRAKLRKLDALGIERARRARRRGGRGRAPPARLHRLQWQGRGVTPEHLRPRFAEHLVRVGRADGAAPATRWSPSSGWSGKVVAVDLTLLSAGPGGRLSVRRPPRAARAEGGRRGDAAARTTPGTAAETGARHAEPAARHRAVQAPLAPGHRRQPAAAAGPAALTARAAVAGRSRDARPPRGGAERAGCSGATGRGCRAATGRPRGRGRPHGAAARGGPAAARPVPGGLQPRAHQSKREAELPAEPVLDPVAQRPAASSRRGGHAASAGAGRRSGATRRAARQSAAGSWSGAAEERGPVRPRTDFGLSAHCHTPCGQ